MLQVVFAILGAVAGFLVGSVVGPPFDVIFVPFGGFAGYKIAPKRRRQRN